MRRKFVTGSDSKQATICKNRLSGEHLFKRNIPHVPGISTVEQAQPTCQFLATNCRLLRIVDCFQLSPVTNCRRLRIVACYEFSPYNQIVLQSFCITHEINAEFATTFFTTQNKINVQTLIHFQLNYLLNVNMGVDFFENFLDHKITINVFSLCLNAGSLWEL